MTIAHMLHNHMTSEARGSDRERGPTITATLDDGPLQGIRIEARVEFDHLGIARSSAFHYEPETKACVEKFIQTLTEQMLWIERFHTLEQPRAGASVPGCRSPGVGPGSGDQSVAASAPPTRWERVVARLRRSCLG
jgi:hypothetical protein